VAPRFRNLDGIVSEVLELARCEIQPDNFRRPLSRQLEGFVFFAATNSGTSTRWDPRSDQSSFVKRSLQQLSGRNPTMRLRGTLCFSVEGSGKLGCCNLAYSAKPSQYLHHLRNRRARAPALHRDGSVDSTLATTRLALRLLGTDPLVAGPGLAPECRLLTKHLALQVSSLQGRYSPSPSILMKTDMAAVSLRGRN